MSEIRFNLIKAFDLLKKKDFINAKLIYEKILAIDQKNFDALFFFSYNFNEF